MQQTTPAVQPLTPATATADAMRQAAELVYQSFAEYYDLFFQCKQCPAGPICAQFSEPFSEVGITNLLRLDNRIVGVCSWYGAEELSERQMVSLRMLLEAADTTGDLFLDLQKFREQVPEIAVDSLYLSRIAVDERCRGAGYGRLLLRYFEEAAQSQGRNKVSLHVRHTNLRAIRFYQSAGYEDSSSAGLGYLALEKLL